MSSMIIRVMALLGFGATFLTAISLTTVTIICSMFVDDCDLWQSAKTVSDNGESVAPIDRKSVV